MMSLSFGENRKFFPRIFVGEPTCWSLRSAFWLPSGWQRRFVISVSFPSPVVPLVLMAEPHEKVLGVTIPTHGEAPG